MQEQKDEMNHTHNKLTHKLNNNYTNDEIFT